MVHLEPGGFNSRPQKRSDRPEAVA